ncbi:MAG: protein TonB [Bacteroidia bacterium]|jgi:protein TonB
MEIKKNKNVDIKYKRGLFFLIGMTVSLGFAYGLMQYKKYDPIEVNDLNELFDEDMMQQEQTQQKEEPPPPPEKPQDPIIEVVEDDVKVEKTVDIDLTFDEDEGFSDVDLGDDEPEDTDEVFKWFQVQEKATFPGGDAAMDAYIREHMLIPDIAYEEAENGTVVVGFTVEKDGSLSNIHIVSKKRLIGYGVEKAAMAVIKKMPRWKPALQRDKPARMAFQKPIRLKFD